MKRLILLWGPLIAITVLAAVFNVNQLFEAEQAIVLYGLTFVTTLILSIAFAKNRILCLSFLFAVPVLSSYFALNWDRIFTLIIPLMAFVISLFPGRKVISQATALYLFILAFVLFISLQLPQELIDQLHGTRKAAGVYYPTITAAILMLLVAIYKRGIEIAMYAGTMTISVLILFTEASPVTWGVLPLVMLIAGIADNSYKMAFKDQLTSIKGRQALMDHLNSLGSHYSIAMVDIDHFKKFNDTYGHKAGDEVLTKVANLLTRVKHGTAYRYGGEEFTIIFHGRNAESSAELCDEIRYMIENSPYHAKKKATKNQIRNGSGKFVDKAVPVTISVGVADTKKVPGGWEDVMKKADDHLYLAKKHGRNKVVT